MNNGAVIVSSIISGAIAGGIGAAAGKNADYPILKGALVTGLIDGALAAIYIAVAAPPTQIGATSGVGALQQEWRL